MLRRLIGILVLVMVVLASVQVVGANPDSQMWYFTENDATGAVTIAIDGTTHHKNNFMSKDSPATGTYTSFKTPKTLWFYAENAAQRALGFGEYSWSVYIYHDTIALDDDEIIIDIYRVATDGTPTIIAHGAKKPGAGKSESEIICTDKSGTQDFTTGERLAVRVSWNLVNSNDPLRVYFNPSTGKLTNVISPSSDPGYPVPELSTLFLLSIGLLTLAGYVLLTKKRK